jgi:diguanylate cyclase (GGDEF)-like protein
VHALLLQTTWVAASSDECAGPAARLISAFMEQAPEITGCFMAAAPLPANEEKRIKALHAYGVLDSAAEQAFDDLARMAALVCDVPIALISLVDRERQWFKSHIGIDVSGSPRNISFCAHAILKPTDVMEVPDAREDPRFALNPLVTGDPHIVFYAGAPILTPTGDPIGTLCIVDYKPRKLTAMQSRVLQGLANQAVTQLELRRSLMVLEASVESQTRYVDQLEREREDLEQENATDSLTGLGNRRAFVERLDVELLRAGSAGTGLSLLYLDVDHFKRYNDSFGHPAGDDVLRQLAVVIKRACRGHDFAARIGGEEFAVVMPGTTRESAFVVAERMRRSVQQAVWLHRPITVSVGATLANARVDTAIQLMERADLALYASKRDGRNRVTMAPT